MRGLMLLLLFPLLMILGGCTASVTDIESEEEAKASVSEVTEEDVIPTDCDESGVNCSCKLPDGREITNGGTVDMFSSAQASCGQTCSQRVDEATCENGTLVRAPGHDFLTCEEAECAACELPWGEQLAEGATQDVYRYDEVGCKDSCQKSTVRCSGGRLVGANLSTYPHPTCVVLECIQCRTPWGDMVDDGAGIRMYSDESPACGQACHTVDIYAKCSGGEFRDVNLEVFKFGTCQMQPCLKCDTPWGTVLNNNQQVSGYRRPSVPCGQSCLEGGNVAPRVCVDGVLTGSSDHSYGSCTPDLCDEGGGAPGFVCRIPWSTGNALPGTGISAYTRESVDCDDDCDNYRVTRICRILDGLWSGNPGAIYPNCTRNCKE